MLLAASALAYGLMQLSGATPGMALAGRMGLSAMLAFTALGHFLFTGGIQMMMPPVVPFRKQLVLLTGVIELLAAAGIHLPALRELTGWLLIVFLVMVLPANLSAASRNVNYRTGTLDGPGRRYLWFRVPLQLLLIFWTYATCIRPETLD